MKPTKLTSWMMMLIFVLGGTTAKAQYFDDVYYTSKKKIANKEVANKQVKHSYYNENEYSEEPTLLSSYNRSSSYNDYDRSVDEYNRRYSSNDEWYDDDYRYQDNKKTKVTVVPERRSDLEYSERIVRYHSPSKITIVGADQVDLYMNDGYYSYDYATDYYGGASNVSVNINLGSPWYSWGGWYDPWFYRPWGYYSSWWYRPYSWGWNRWYAGWYDPWYDPWWGSSWSWGGWYGGWYGSYWGGWHHPHLSLIHI